MKVSIGPNPFIQPNPVLIIGSYDQNGNPNIMTVAWGSMCCSVPPCVTISPAKKSRTCENIMTSQAFTINIPSIDFVKDYFIPPTEEEINRIKYQGRFFLYY